MLKNPLEKAFHIVQMCLFNLLKRRLWALFFLFLSFISFQSSAQVSIEDVQHLVNNNQMDSAAKHASLGIDYIQQNQLRYTEDLIYFSTVLIQADQPKKALSTLLSVSEFPDLTKNQKASVHAKLGELFMAARSWQLSIENLKQTLHYYEQDNVAIYYWLGQIGRNYIDLNFPDSARIYFNKQLSWATQRDSLHEVALAKNNIGFAFVKEGNPDSGVYYYQKAIEDLLKEDMTAYDLILYSNLQINVGKLFYKKGMIKPSQIYLEEAYKVANQQSGEEDTKPLIIEAGFELFQTYLALKQFKDAETVMNELMLLPDLTHDDQYELSKRNLILCIEDPSRPVHEDKLLDFIQASEKQREKFENMSDNNVELTSNYLINLATTENKLNKSLIEQANAKLKVSEQRKQSILLWSISLGLIVIMAIGGGLYYVNNKRRQARLRSELLEKDKENLEYELKLKEQDLTNFAITLSMKKEQTQEILDMLEKLKKVDQKNLKSGVDELIRELKNKLNTEKTLDKFEQNFELVNAKFFDKLTDQFPKLTRYEREFCAMIRLNLNNKEIASLKGISLNSAKVSKYRLKKKLELGEEDDIALFLQKL